MKYSCIPNGSKMRKMISPLSPVAILFLQHLPCGDWNGHVGSSGTGYEEVHGGHGFGIRNPDTDGERILEFVFTNDLLLGNTWFKKRDSHLVTYESGGAATQIDFIMYYISACNVW